MWGHPTVVKINVSWVGSVVRQNKIILVALAAVFVKIYLFSNKADAIHVKNSKLFLQENEKHKENINETFFHKRPNDGSDPHNFNMPSNNTEKWVQHFINKINANN